MMDFKANTEEPEYKLNQDSTLLEILKEICSDPTKLSSKLKGKVDKIMADCDLQQHSSLQRVNTVDESSSTVLGFLHQSKEELSYDEQAELNQAFIENIEKKIPSCINELDKLNKSTATYAKLRDEQRRELKERDSKLNTLQEQESEQMDLMMTWLSHQIQGMSKYNDNWSELLSNRVQIVNLKSKIIHLQILQNIFTETNQSIKSYSEVHKDLKEVIKETEQRINSYKEIIESDQA